MSIWVLQVAAELRRVGTDAEREHGGQQAQERLATALAALQVSSCKANVPGKSKALDVMKGRRALQPAALCRCARACCDHIVAQQAAMLAWDGVFLLAPRTR